MGTWRTGTACVAGTALLGALLLAGGLTLIFAVPGFIRSQIKQKVQLVPGSELYDIWKEPKIPIYLQFYVFNLTNPGEVMKGEKPVVQQHGPYTYHEHREKVDIVSHENGTLSYHEIKTYLFDRNMSAGWDTEKFTTCNLVLAAVVDAFYSLPIPKQLGLKVIIELMKPKMFVQRSVRDIVWGYKDPVLAKLYPWFVDTDVVGIMTGKNASASAEFTINTGEFDISRLGVIERYKGSSALSYWTSAQANMINGTDGTICPPFVTKDRVLYMFSTDICRSVYGTYHGVLMNPEGIKLWRFRAPESALANATVNPANAGFCTPRGHCMGSGVLNISVCQTVDTLPVPVITSFPHFFMADDEYVNAIIGMDPDSGLYTTDIDIEPHTGLVMEISKRLQINAYLQKFPDFSGTGQIPTMVYPILWLNESAQVTRDLADRVKNQLLLPKKIVGIVQFIILALGGVILAAAVMLGIRTYYKVKDKEGTTSEHTKKESQSPPGVSTDDTAPLIKEEEKD